MTVVDWPGVWGRVAERIADHRAAGRAHLLTEDSVRLMTVLSLEESGVAPGRLVAEMYAPALLGGKLDLVVDPPAGVLIELKFPRDSRSGISPDTMTLGELLRDFLRVAIVPAEDRWVVQVLNDRLARYVENAFERYGLRWASAPGEVVELPSTAVALLPATARRVIGDTAAAGTVRATCRASLPAGDALSLLAYRVHGGARSTGPTSGRAVDAAVVEPAGADSPPAVRNARAGARQEILQAARAVVTRAGRAEFTLHEVVDEMRRRGTTYTEATIRTMISSHLCAEATGSGIAGYTDLTRVDRGVYRLRP